jgi:peptide/nickel transport system ATP-binding protein
MPPGSPIDSNSGHPLLEARSVSRTFRVSAGALRRSRTLTAVNDVSLAVRPGEVVGLVGESGCGKTTLARMLLGLLPPSLGTISIGGQPLSALGRRDVAALIQPVFQDPYSSLNPRKSVGTIITLPLRIHGAPQPATWRSRVEAMMERVGLSRTLYDNYPSQLSGGQRQRVAIARALINEPRMVICDEPTSALDVSVQSQILNLLQDLRRDLGLTYLLISHNLAVVEHMATRVAVMYLGRIVEEADTDQLFRAPKHPYTQALLASVLTPEPGLGVPDTHLGVAYPNPLDIPLGCRFHPRCDRVMDVCKSVAPASTPTDSGFVECHLYGAPSHGDLTAGAVTAEWRSKPDAMTAP